MAKKVKKTKPKDIAFLEMVGHINFVECTNGKTKRTKLDSKACLKCVLNAIEDAIRTYC